MTISCQGNPGLFLGGAQPDLATIVETKVVLKPWETPRYHPSSSSLVILSRALMGKPMKTILDVLGTH